MLALIPPGTGETGLASQLAGAAANDTELLAIHGRQVIVRRGDRAVEGPLMGKEPAGPQGWMGEESRPGAEQRGRD